MTRKPDEHKTRTSSRRNKFEELYKKVKDETTDWMQVIANAEEDGKIRSKKMYLYLTQKGRCMYTGKHIELDDLFDNNLYDIDNIAFFSKMRLIIRIRKRNDRNSRRRLIDGVPIFLLNLIPSRKIDDSVDRKSV